MHRRSMRRTLNYFQGQESRIFCKSSGPEEDFSPSSRHAGRDLPPFTTGREYRLHSPNMMEWMA